MKTSAKHLGLAVRP